jgi:hypothetical protein
VIRQCCWICLPHCCANSIESPKLVGDKQQYKFFKFYINNGMGKRVQVVAWNDNIDYVENEVSSNNVSFFNIYYFYLSLTYYKIIIYYYNILIDYSFGWSSS